MSGSTDEFVRDGAVLRVDRSDVAGVSVIFQHGLGGDAAQAAEIFPDLPGFRRVTIVCRGHGMSELGPLPGLSIASFADDIAALIQSENLAPAIVGGISMGAAIATRLAVRQPQLVRALVLARPAWLTESAPQTLAPYAEVGRLLATLTADAARTTFLAGATAHHLADAAPDNLASLLGFFSREPVAATATLLQAIAADGPGITSAELAAIRVPTLVIGHGRDVVHPLALAQHLAALIPGARLVTITPKAEDRARYCVEFRAALTDFLEEIS